MLLAIYGVMAVFFGLLLLRYKPPFHLAGTDCGFAGNSGVLCVVAAKRR